MKKIFLFLMMFSLSSGTVFAQGTNPVEILPSVTVIWDEPVLQNTASDNSGIWFYEIASNGDVVKSTDVDTYLVMSKSHNQTGNVTVIPLGAYPAGAGLSFPVTYPSCVDLNCPDIINSPIEPGYDYLVYFSPDVSGVEVFPGGEVLSLPVVPNTVNTAENYITLTATFAENNLGQTYIQATGNVLENVSDGYRVTAIGKDNDGSRDDQNYYLGFVPGNMGEYSLPDINSSPSIDITYDSYDVVIEYNETIIHTINIGSVQEPIVNTSGGGGLSTGFSGDQYTILGTGIVPTDCGYNLGRGGSGRMCGFADIIQLIQNVIEYIFILILPISAIVFAYAGYKLLSSRGNSTQLTAAKTAITKVITGIVVIMLAWLIVKTILVALGASEGFTMFLDIG